jgi:hypothetical protein
LVDNLLLEAASSQVAFGACCTLTALSAATLFCLQETNSFMTLQRLSEEPLLILSQSDSHSKLSLSIILHRFGAGIRCIFASKKSRFPGIVFAASLLTLQVKYQAQKC